MRTQLLAGALTIMVGASAWAETGSAPATRAELVSEMRAVQPGRPFWVGVRLTMAPGWHTYWTNPGEAGLATSVRWELPEGVSAGPLEWPTPARLVTGSGDTALVSYGYEGEAVLLAQVTPPAGAEPGASLPVRGRVDWVECRDVCVKRAATVELAVPIAAEEAIDPPAASVLAHARLAQPADLPTWRVQATAEGARMMMTTSGASDHPPTQVVFVPADRGIIDDAAPQPLALTDHGHRLELTRSQYATAWPERLRGVLLAEDGWQAGGAPRGLAVDVPINGR